MNSIPHPRTPGDQEPADTQGGQTIMDDGSGKPQSRPGARKTRDGDNRDVRVPSAKRTRRKREAPPRKKDDKLFVVGVGSSAGGLEALRPFVAHLPRASNMAYVVVQHLSPQYRSMMVQLLSRETDLEVVEIADDMPVKADTIYITPASKDVRIRNGVLVLKEPSAPLGPKPSVDVFFTSLAEDCGPNAIGVILSGTGTDGAHGFRALKAHEGFTIAQAPDSAKYDGMPRAAIDTGCADLIVRPEEMGAELAAIAHFPRPAMHKPEVAASNGTLQTLFRLVRSRTGIDFTLYKINTIQRRLERRLTANRIQNLEGYLEYVQAQPTELDLLCKDILISVTSFFRDAKAFAEIKDVLADLVKGKNTLDTLRIWVPGCATGEEAYSLAMLLDEQMLKHHKDCRVQIFATDVDSQAMSHARRGVYSETALENVDEAYLSRYFEPLGSAYQVRKSIREKVVFARQDLAKDPPFVKVDLISCRNVLIYFNQELQDRVFRLFHYALNPDGCIFLGKSESIGRNTDLFAPVRPNSKIFRKRLDGVRREGPLFGPFQPSLQRTLEDGAAKTRSLEDAIKDGFVSACMPPSVAVNADLEALYYHGDVQRFINIPRGVPTNSLPNLLNDDFRTDLRALAHRARARNEVCTGPKRRVPGPEGEETLVHMVVRPIPVERYESVLLVSWETVDTPSVPATEAELSAEHDSRLAELEQELTATREHL